MLMQAVDSLSPAKTRTPYASCLGLRHTHEALTIAECSKCQRLDANALDSCLAFLSRMVATLIE